MEENRVIKCPNCSEQIDVNSALYNQLESKHKSEFLAQKRKLDEEIELKRKEYKAHFEELKKQEELLKLEGEKFKEKLENETNKRVKELRLKLEDELKKSILKEHEESINLMKKELEEKSILVKEFHATKALVEKLKRENSEIELKIKAKAEEELNSRLLAEKEKIQKTIDEQNELRFKQKDEQLEQLKKQLQEAQRKAELGSQQLQGEVQELAIEEWLKDKFPFDTIEEVKKGARGADCMQIVHTREVQNCGKIYYESKRTKEFQKSWIEKFKADMRDKGADLGVLVTDAMPNDMDRMGMYEGIWICSFEEFKALCAILRESIIKVHYAQKSQENRNDKMSMIYSYLTSTEFKMQIEALVEGFTQMQSDLDSEKRSMQRIWKQREKQIEKVLENTIGMYGSIKGIAGQAIGNIKALELGYEEEV